MITISLCMIVKNEEDLLGRCLESVHEFVDEIIIVDTGSTDNTVSVAKHFTNNIHSFQWIDDFSAARNFSFSKATKDYILWLDADDVIYAEDQKRFQLIKKTLAPDTDIVMLPYHAAFDNIGKPTFTYFRERLVRRKSNPVWMEPVHEHLIISGKILKLDAAVSHLPEQHNQSHSNRNLNIYRKQLNEGKTLSTRGMYYFARELKTHGLYEEAILQYHDALNKKDIWVEDAITASADLADCYRKKGMDDEALHILFSSFSYDLPRAEIVCRIGDIYADKKEDLKAIFWYETIFHLSKPDGWGFFSKDYWDYIPHMQLCMLYSRIGNDEKSLFHHQTVKKLYPENKAVIYNDAYFNKVK